jgi:hypothetical protein
VEQQFFKGDPFWSDPEQGGIAVKRFGVDNLRKELSNQLVRLTEKELPKIIAAVEEALQQVGLSDCISRACLSFQAQGPWA